MIDKQGRIFGKVNFFDAFVWLLILCLIPMVFFAYKIVNKPQPPPVIITTYPMKDKCPVCKIPIKVEIDKGKPVPVGYQAVCNNCGNKIVLFVPKPKPMPLTYEEQWFKRELEGR